MACEGNIPPERQIIQLQAAASQQAVWSPERNNRCREVIFTILLPGHLIDLVQAIAALPRLSKHIERLSGSRLHRRLHRGHRRLGSSGATFVTTAVYFPRIPSTT